MKDEHRAGDAAVRVVKGSRRVLDRGLATVAGNQHAVRRGSHGPVLLDCAQRGALGGLTCRAVDHPEHLRKRPAGRVPASPAGHRLSHPIQVGDLAVEVGGQHGLAEGIERDLGVPLPLEQFHAVVHRRAVDPRPRGADRAEPGFAPTLSAIDGLAANIAGMGDGVLHDGHGGPRFAHGKSIGPFHDGSGPRVFATRSLLPFSKRLICRSASSFVMP